MRCLWLSSPESLMDCPARQLCDYFTSTLLLTTEFSGTIPGATIKTMDLMQWHGTICIVNVFLLSEREIRPNYTGIFWDFVHGFGSYSKGLPKTKRCNSVAVTVSVRFRFGFGVYVKRPLKRTATLRSSEALIKPCSLPQIRSKLINKRKIRKDTEFCIEDNCKIWSAATFSICIFY